MKKLFLAVTAFIITAVSVNAQETDVVPSGTTFSIAGNVGSGTTNNYKLSAGADIQLDIPMGSGLKFTASAGYQNFAYELPGLAKDNQSFIPLLAGLKFGLGKGLYGHGQLGYSLATEKGDGNWFTYAPSIGYGFGKNFDLAVKYLSINKVNALLARLAYNF